MASVGARVRQLRKGHGWSQKQLAELAGLSRATIAALELGRYASHDTATLQALAAALHVPVSRLADGALRQMPAAGARAEILAIFLASTWPKALRLVPAEIAWLDSLPFAFWQGMEEKPQMVAELLAWRRRNALTREN